MELELEKGLVRQACLALLGPRQVGKTTLARNLVEKYGGLYLDVSAPYDQTRLSDPYDFLSRYEANLVVIDEVHRAPELFVTLRGLIDEGRRRGKRTGRFLLLGSASVDLLRQTGETLAGRIEYFELTPVNVLEIIGHSDTEELWLRGGFPDSLLAASDNDSFRFRTNLVATYLGREIGEFGLRLPAQTMERLWQMLAQYQGNLANISQLATNLQLSARSLSRYLDLLEDFLLIRRLPPFMGNQLKRLVKSPKMYIRDTGLLHALAGISNMYDLLGSPLVGGSWEGFVIETLVSLLPPYVKYSFFRTGAGAEIDLILEFGGRNGTWAIEIKRSQAARPSRGFHVAIADIQASRAYVVHSGTDRFRLAPNVESIGLVELANEIRKTFLHS